MLELTCKTWLNAAATAAAVQAASIPRIKLAALAIAREAKRSMVGGGKRHVPSPPGTPPHRQSTALAGSIDVEGPTSVGTYLAGPKVFYGKIHEFGLIDRRGRYFPPRPFMRPAMLKAAGALPELFRNLPLAGTAAGARLNGGPPPV